MAALEDLLLRVSALVEAHPEIAELDCNPVKALPDRVVVVDARIRVEAASLPLPLAGRRRRWKTLRAVDLRRDSDRRACAAAHPSCATEVTAHRQGCEAV